MEDQVIKTAFGEFVPAIREVEVNGTIYKVKVFVPKPKPKSIWSVLMRTLQVGCDKSN